MHKLNPSDRGYSLAKVAQIEFGGGTPSQVGTPSRVEISWIEVHDRQFGHLYFLACFMVAVWEGFGYWFFFREVCTKGQGPAS